MLNCTQRKKFQSSYIWLKRNDSIVLLDNKEDHKSYQTLINIYTQNIHSFAEAHRSCLEDIQNGRAIKQNCNENISLKQLQQIYFKNEAKITKEILHRNFSIRKTLQSFTNTFSLPTLLSQQKVSLKKEVNLRVQSPNKGGAKKQIVIIDEGFRRQNYFDRQTKYNSTIRHFDKIYQSITSGVFTKKQVLFTEEAKPHSFFSQKDRYVLVPNRIKMAKIASKVKKTELSKRNFQEEDGLVRKQKTNKVSMSLGDQILNKFGMSKQQLKLDFSAVQTKKCFKEIARLKQKMELNKSKQMQLYNSISKANILQSIIAPQHQGYRPKNRYFQTIFQLNRQSH